MTTTGTIYLHLPYMRMAAWSLIRGESLMWSVALPKQAMTDWCCGVIDNARYDPRTKQVRFEQVPDGEPMRVYDLSEEIERMAREYLACDENGWKPKAAE